MQYVEQVSLFLASPGDVSRERAQVRSVVAELNLTLGKARGFIVDVWDWQTHAAPAFGGDAQSLINRQADFLDSCDVFVGLMWNRFGTPTPRAASGTEEEFRLAVSRYERAHRPEILFYFRSSPARLSTQEQLDQKGRVLRFKAEMQQAGLTWDYQSVADFRTQFHRHLSNWLMQRG